jgi:23S rRNA pseudouridine2457 synthase
MGRGATNQYRGNAEERKRGEFPNPDREGAKGRKRGNGRRTSRVRNPTVPAELVTQCVTNGLGRLSALSPFRAFAIPVFLFRIPAIREFHLSLVTRPSSLPPVLIALHKPYGVLSQFTPEPGSKWRTLSEFGLPPQVYALGRLDADSEGLLLLSDEPGLNSRLLDPAHAHRREYWALVEGIPSADALARLARGGIPIDDYETLPCQARLLEPAPAVAPRDPPVRLRKTVPDRWLALELVEGKNRQVRRMTAAVGYPTLRLLRARIGGFALGDLAAGKWRELTAPERAAVFG